MRKQLSLALALGLLLAFVLAGAAQAQEPRPTPTNEPLSPEAQDDTRGSIRGTVYRDENNDGLCVGTGEPALSGIPIRFTSGDGATQLYLQSGGDGSYGLVAAGLGTWQVAADPAATQGVITSAATRSVTLTAENSVATGVDFCIGTAVPRNVVLPEAGAPAMPALWLAMLAGTLFVGLGLVLAARERFIRH